MKNIAKQYHTAVAEADEAALRALFAPGATVWHNHDRKLIPFEESANSFTLWLADFDSYSCTIDRAIEGPNHLVLQDTIIGQLKGSVGGEAKPFKAHYCLVFHIEAGKVIHLDEYVDPQTVSR